MHEPQQCLWQREGLWWPFGFDLLWFLGSQCICSALPVAFSGIVIPALHIIVLHCIVKIWITLYLPSPESAWPQSMGSLVHRDLRVQENRCRRSAHSLVFLGLLLLGVWGKDRAKDCIAGYVLAMFPLWEGDTFPGLQRCSTLLTVALENHHVPQLATHFLQRRNQGTFILLMNSTQQCRCQWKTDK